MSRIIFIGWDARDELAYNVAVRSIHKHASKGVMVVPLKDHELRRAGFYWRQYQVRPNGQKIDESDGRSVLDGLLILALLRSRAC